MTFSKSAAFVLLAALIGIALAGATAEARGMRWGSGRESVQVMDIYKDFSKFKGRIVTLEGTVAEQDERGYDHWLILTDGTGMIKVNLWVYNVSFREIALGHKVRVIGKVTEENGRYMINATKIYMGKRFYSGNRDND